MLYRGAILSACIDFSFSVLEKMETNILGSILGCVDSLILQYMILETSILLLSFLYASAVRLRTFGEGTLSTAQFSPFLVDVDALLI